MHATRIRRTKIHRYLHIHAHCMHIYASCKRDTYLDSFLSISIEVVTQKQTPCISPLLCLSFPLCLCVSVSLSLYLCVLHALSLLLSRARTVSLSLPHSNTRVCAHSLAFHVSCCLSAEQPTLSYTHTNNNTTNFAFTFALPLSFLSDKKIWKTSTYSLVVKRHKEGVSNFKYEETIQEYVEFNCWCPARVQGK